MLKLKEWDFPNSGAATANVNAWSGAAMFTLLLGAFIADSYLALSMIIVASFLYVLAFIWVLDCSKECKIAKGLDLSRLIIAKLGV
ncbi:hypothetical protein DCAR_0519048 [Daucus carota subsp. sativus]|uniref:Uncharacterized protein n=1 Tax=Daucus carota subsp. sativus TaxID=79200 RepID=A0A162A0X2_DAUCS|nr:hypothetical protein DCAR_0519048 [Daucus carota subsp. sativus]